MVVRELNIEIIRGFFDEIGSFYEKIEFKYWMFLLFEVVFEKFVVQDLFKELN